MLFRQDWYSHQRQPHHKGHRRNQVSPHTRHTQTHKANKQTKHTHDSEEEGGTSSDKHGLIPARESPFTTQCVLASCHSLVLLDGELVGDPLEKVALNAVDWNLSKGGEYVVFPCMCLSVCSIL